MPQDMEPKFETKEIPIAQIDNNFGQIEGVPENPRTITTTDFLNLKKSLEDDPGFLWLREPLVYPLNGRYVAIAGNQRIRALKELPIEFTPAKILDAETPVEDLIRWAVKDNTNKGEWDWDALSNGEWPEDKLTDWGLDLPEDWGEAHTHNPEEDEIPEPPKTPVSKLGDLWLLDAHRVLCGDSTDRATVERLMDGKKADMVFTDPPYGMNLDTDYSFAKNNYTNVKSKGGNKYEKVIGDNEDFKPELITTIFENFGYSEEIFIWGADYFSEEIPERNKGSWIVWDKRSNDGADEMKAMQSDKAFGSAFELCWSKNRHKRLMCRVRSGIFGVNNEQGTSNRFHPTEKPVQVAVWFFDNWAKAGGFIADLFLGSGSTLIACEQTNRQCYGLELDPSYVDVVVSRFIKFTNGEKPVINAETGEDCRHLFRAYDNDRIEG